MLHDWQKDFARGLEGKPSVIAWQARFGLYRTSVKESLVEVLGTAYPATAKWLGYAEFRQLAMKHLETCPPGKPMLWRYGEGLEGLLAFSPPRQELARVEWLMGQSYFAQEVPPLSSARLMEGDSAEKHLCLHPSLHLLVLDWPAMKIWQDYRAGRDLAQPESMSPERSHLLIARSHGEVGWRSLSPAAFHFLSALRRGEPLGGAIGDLPLDELQAELGLLLRDGLLVEENDETA